MYSSMHRLPNWMSPSSRKMIPGHHYRGQRPRIRCRKIVHTGGVDPNAEGVGLKNIRSRVAFLNGELDIKQPAGEGTLIACSIPVKRLSI